MTKYSLILVLAVFVINTDAKLLKKRVSPPHCTQVTKDTDYVSYYKLDYPVAYLIPGQHEAYQKLYCLNPPTVHKAVTTVCDWAAPPQVQYTLGDDFVHVVRQDPSGRFLGNAVINTYQLCEMYSNWLFACVFLRIWYSCCSQFLISDVKFYEYGEHVEGEQISYIYNGNIPVFQPIYTLNVTMNKGELKHEFTYLRVEYYNIMSDVKVNFDPEASTLIFHVKFPFLSTPFGILGYSLPNESKI